MSKNVCSLMKAWKGTVDDFCQYQKLNGGKLDAAMKPKLEEAKVRHLL